jgi:hypothetical protein
VLQAPPPGHSPFAINRQFVQSGLPAQPGSQQQVVLGAPTQTMGAAAPPGASSYLPPSSQPLAPPAMPAGGALAAANTQAIIKALAARGAGGRR